MATIVTIQSTDVIANSRADLNTNFTNLNSDKIETSYLDTDTSLTANSDTKIPSQKAVKTYVDAGGNVNASETTKGIVEEATDAEVVAKTATGATGAKLFITPAKLSNIVKFGGTGADGALTITSGATNIDCANAAVVTKNYTSISITGTGSLTFTNPHANGTIITLKSQGDVTITSSTVPAITLVGMGAAGGADGTTTGVAGSKGNSSIIFQTNAGAGTNRTVAAAGGVSLGTFLSTINSKFVPLFCGAGGSGGCTGDGGSGTGASGAGGASAVTSGGAGSVSGNTGTGVAGDGSIGGGALYIECGGAYNASSTLSVAGTAGVAGSASQGSGGGGGAGGTIIILYTTLTSNTGTYTVTGGAGGALATGGQNGGAGGAGYSLVALNTEFV